MGAKAREKGCRNSLLFNETEIYDFQRMGIDLVINQKQEQAEEVFNMLLMPGA